jgi:hypothetical protein
METLTQCCSMVWCAVLCNTCPTFLNISDNPCSLSSRKMSGLALLTRKSFYLCLLYALNHRLVLLFTEPDYRGTIGIRQEDQEQQRNPTREAASQNRWNSPTSSGQRILMQTSDGRIRRWLQRLQRLGFGLMSGELSTTRTQSSTSSLLARKDARSPSKQAGDHIFSLLSWYHSKTTSFL